LKLKSLVTLQMPFAVTFAEVDRNKVCLLEYCTFWGSVIYLSIIFLETFYFNFTTFDTFYSTTIDDFGLQGLHFGLKWKSGWRQNLTDVGFRHQLDFHFQPKYNGYYW